ncbi:MAG TPA: CDP-alcohol phosphatidyltransferase family protein [Jatrophihabitantaceae bacterium]|nr:CDP-alcohol phosphatidyltransferase family protein [Jatrophihabitantaceae bacterium]
MHAVRIPLGVARQLVAGWANRITSLRAVLVLAVTALVGDAYAGAQHVWVMLGLCTAALLLDGVDGPVARRSNTESAFGARFDMEVDAFLIFVLSCFDARAFGAWVLLLGGARYLFVAAGWCAPWLRLPVPPRFWRKVVAAAVGIVLAVAAADVLPHWAATLALVGALLLLVESFGRDVRYLWVINSNERTPGRLFAAVDQPRPRFEHSRIRA